MKDEEKEQEADDDDDGWGKRRVGIKMGNPHSSYDWASGNSRFDFIRVTAISIRKPFKMCASLGARRTS